VNRLRRVAKWTLGGIAGLVLLTLLMVKIVYGGGKPYPDVSTDPVVAGADVETLVELDYPPGNVTVSSDGRIFFNTHPFVASNRFADAFVFELVDGEPQPFPNDELQPDLAWVFGMHADAQGRLWLISPATLDRERTRIQAFDLETNTRIVDHELDPGVARFSQDLRITPDGRTAILADTGAFQFTAASLIVLDLETKQTRRVLDEHPSTQPQDWTIRIAHGTHAIGWGLVTFSVGVDGIAITPDAQWLYYATMSHDTLYRVPLASVLDASLPADALAAKVEAVGPKPLSDGITLTDDGRVLVTDVENGGIAEAAAGTSLRTLVKLDSVVWADGIAMTPDGRAVFTDSAIPSYLDPLLLPPDPAVLAAGRPYRIQAFSVPPSN